MKRFLHECLRLFYVASLTLLLRIDFLAGAEEGRKDFGEFQARVQRLERAIEGQRQKLGIPGLAIVVVHHEGMMRTKGFGFRNIEKRLPVTSDSLFGIGSCTKAFTGAAAVMSVEAGKLSLDDSPKRFLPYFRLADPVADERATLKDLLTHRTGLTAYDDEVWHKNDKLSREEVIKAVMSKPATAKFRTAFQYNNVMYSAVGECIGKANNSTWEGVISNFIFQPLGMRVSNTSLREMRESPDFTIGYHLPGKNPRPEKDHDLNNVAASGAINSSASDMAQWIRFMLGWGVLDGKRLMSDAGFHQLITPEIGHYALGWEVLEVGGHKTLISEGGAVGHAARVTVDLDAGTGWAVLANVNNVREFRQMANFIDRSLGPMPQLSLWRAPTNAAAIVLWLAFLVLVGVVVARMRRGRQRSWNFDCNHPTRSPLRRPIMILIGAAILVGVFLALSSFMAGSPWLVIHVPALQWLRLGSLFCGATLLVTGFLCYKTERSCRTI
jgi:CubicO group peptidase (beta-lactamase class C family)